MRYNVKPLNIISKSSLNSPNTLRTYVDGFGLKRRLRDVKRICYNIIDGGTNDNDNDDDTILDDINWNNFNTFEGKKKAKFNARDYVSATRIKNYMMKDPIVDWLSRNNDNFGDNMEGSNTVLTGSSKSSTVLTGSSKSSTVLTGSLESNTFQAFSQQNDNILFEMGYKFEDTLIDHLKNTFPGKIKRVANTYKDIRKENHNLTKIYMMQGIPIIEQAVLFNEKNKTFGCADILIRSDWINKIVKRSVLTKEEEMIKAPKLSGNYHYLVIDIKWTTLNLCSNGRLIRNSNRIPAYKGQLAIYNAAMGLIQGYIPNKAYILAKSWKYTKKNINYCGYSCFDLLGEIDYSTFDKDYILTTKKGIEWVRNVRYNGYKWSVSQTPLIPELYPNMNNKYDDSYRSEKCRVASENDELTQIWNVSVKNRIYAHRRGIYRWSDPRCNAKRLGINGKKIGKIVNKILDTNRDSKGIVLQPNKILNNMQNWQIKKELEFYVDFEMISNVLYNCDINLTNSKQDSNILFMIGVGYKDNDTWIYESFVMRYNTIEEEYRVMEEFINFIDIKINLYIEKYGVYNDEVKPVLFHWGNAEKTTIDIVNQRHGYKWTNWLNKLEWLDFYNVFKDEPITIKGVFKFDLKSIAHSMYKNGYINTIWDNNTNISTGLQAMNKAIYYYKYVDNNGHDNYSCSIINDIMKYNEIDCKTLYEIVIYLRNNNI